MKFPNLVHAVIKLIIILASVIGESLSHRTSNNEELRESWKCSKETVFRRIPHPSACRKFMECRLRRYNQYFMEVVYCPSDFLFDKIELECVSPDELNPKSTCAQSTHLIYNRKRKNHGFGKHSDFFDDFDEHFRPMALAMKRHRKTEMADLEQNSFENNGNQIRSSNTKLKTIKTEENEAGELILPSRRGMAMTMKQSEDNTASSESSESEEIPPPSSVKKSGSNDKPASKTTKKPESSEESSEETTISVKKNEETGKVTTVSTKIEESSTEPIMVSDIFEFDTKSTTEIEDGADGDPNGRGFKRHKYPNGTYMEDEPTTKSTITEMPGFVIHSTIMTEKVAKTSTIPPFAVSSTNPASVEPTTKPTITEMPGFVIHSTIVTEKVVKTSTIQPLAVSSPSPASVEPGIVVKADAKSNYGTALARAHSEQGGTAIATSEVEDGGLALSSAKSLGGPAIMNNSAIATSMTGRGGHIWANAGTDNVDVDDEIIELDNYSQEN